jgi:hemerythrin-like domain-containing protein
MTAYPGAWNRLQREHEQLRRTFAELEAVVDDSQARCTISPRLCHDFSDFLATHMRKEWRLAILCSRQLGCAHTSALARFAAGHQVDHERFECVRRMMLNAGETARPMLRIAVQGFSQALHGHLEEQERHLFPSIQRHLEECGHPEWIAMSEARGRNIAEEP